MSVITITITIALASSSSGIGDLDARAPSPRTVHVPWGYVHAQHPNVPLNWQDHHADHAEVGARRGTLA